MPAAAKTALICIALALAAGGAWLFLRTPPQAREAPPSRPRCAPGLRNLATALELYAQDYDGRLPRAAVWQKAIEPYHRIPERAGCPAAGGRVGYAFNSALSGQRASFNFQQPPRPLLFDSSNLTANAADPLRSFIARHQGWGNVVYTDGHVRSFRAAPADPPAPKER